MLSFRRLQRDDMFGHFKKWCICGKEWIPDRGVYDCRFYPYESASFVP